MDFQLDFKLANWNKTSETFKVVYHLISFDFWNIKMNFVHCFYVDKCPVTKDNF